MNSKTIYLIVVLFLFGIVIGAPTNETKFNTTYELNGTCPPCDCTQFQHNDIITEYLVDEYTTPEPETTTTTQRPKKKGFFGYVFSFFNNLFTSFVNLFK